MFDNLTNKISAVFDKLTARGKLTALDIDTALREVRIALLEADVALPVVKDIINKVKEEALGEAVIKSVKPSEQIIKIVNDTLIAALGSSVQELDFKHIPSIFLMLGLQGSGKTTTSAKIANLLKLKHNKKILLASLDVYRPAAQEQLQTLASQIGVDSLPIVQGQKPLDITKRALKETTLGGYDILILDTAGRLHIDNELIEEVIEVHKLAKPNESLLVLDSMIGQDAALVAKEFNDKIPLTGVVLTRIDGDQRGGAALSMKGVTGVPIKLMGMGEKISDIEPFYPERIASRILGMGDIVSLVEQSISKIQKEDAEKLANNFISGKFTLNDFLAQMQQIKKMGSIKSILSLMPGINKMQSQLEKAGLNEDIMKKQEAIILSMTKKERTFPEIIKASRKNRIAAGSGTCVNDVNKLLKQFEKMQSAMKKMKKFGLMDKLMPNANFSPDDLIGSLGENMNTGNLDLNSLGIGGDKNPFGNLGGGKMPHLPNKFKFK